MYEVCFKNRVFFGKAIVIKMKIKGVTEDLKIKKNFYLKNIIVKIYIDISLELLWAVWGSVHIHIVP